MGDPELEHDPEHEDAFEDEAVVELPDREAMSLINPSGGLTPLPAAPFDAALSPEGGDVPDDRYEE